MPKLSVTAPVDFRNWRREVWRVIISTSLRSAHDSTNDSVVSAAAAKVSVKRGSDFRLCGLGIAVQQRLCLHDQARCAITTLSRLLMNEGLLQLAGLAIHRQTCQSCD